MPDYGQTWGVDPIWSALGYLANCPILAIPVETTQFGQIQSYLVNCQILAIRVDMTQFGQIKKIGGRTC